MTNEGKCLSDLKQKQKYQLQSQHVARSDSAHVVPLHLIVPAALLGVPDGAQSKVLHSVKYHIYCISDSYRHEPFEHSQNSCNFPKYLLKF